MTRYNPYPEFPLVSPEHVQAAFYYSPTSYRLIRRLPQGKARACAPAEGHAQVVWDGRRWPLLLLVWLCTHGHWPERRIMRMQGESNRVDNLMEKY